MFERFTEPSRRVLVLAQNEARLLGHSFMGTEHILLGLIAEGESLAAQALGSLDIELSAARDMAAATIGLTGSAPTGSPPFTPRSKKVLELSLRSALQLGDSEIAPEHILLGVIEEGEGVGAQILINLGADLDRVRQEVVRRLVDTRGDTGLGERLTHRPILPTGLRQQAREPTVGAPQMWHQGRLVACSFCGRTPPESGQMVAGNDAFICERCLRVWVGRVDQMRLSQRRWGATQYEAVAPGPQPEDPDAARNEIEVAFAASNSESEDGRSVPSVEKGDNLGPTLAAARANRPDISARVVISVDEVVFVDTQHAAVWFSISVDGHPLLSHHRGDAVLVDGTWKMARSTFCQLMAMGGVSRPLESE